MSIENTIKQMIAEKINEKSTLDYKVQEYEFNSIKKWEMIKDVIAMLNSEEAYGKDKFIILGVVDKSFYIKGLELDMRDDNEYQNLFNSIEPRPKIETGQVDIDGKKVGYIFIDKINDQRPYTIALDNEKYCQGTSFIRRGSTNVSMDDKTREQLILSRFIKTSQKSETYQNILNQNAIKSKVYYTNTAIEGEAKINPSNNNGQYIIGEGLYEFKLRFDVAHNGIARIMNDYGILVARMKNKAALFESYQDINYKELDYTARLRQYEINDLAIVVNGMGKYALITFVIVESESHIAHADLIEFKWKIIQ